MPDPYAHKLVLVTGGSSGIGLAIACQLAARGSDVWILARDLLKLQQAPLQINEARHSPSQRTGALQVDLKDYQATCQALDAFQKKTGTPDILVNAAGVAHPGLVEKTREEVYREMIESNYLGTVHATMALLPGMISRGSGQIINFASAAGIVGLPGYAAYGASKYAVRGFSDTLRVELKPKGIKVSIVFPSDVDTPQLAYENIYKPQITRTIEEIMGVTKPGRPEVVARQVLAAAARGKYIILPGGDAKFIFFLVNFLGTGIYPFGDFLVRMALRRLEAEHARQPAAPR